MFGGSVKNVRRLKDERYLCMKINLCPCQKLFRNYLVGNNRSSALREHLVDILVRIVMF